jgi:hypothetical protein
MKIQIVRDLTVSDLFGGYIDTPEYSDPTEVIITAGEYDTVTWAENILYYDGHNWLLNDQDFVALYDPPEPEIDDTWWQALENTEREWEDDPEDEDIWFVDSLYPVDDDEEDDDAV